MFLSSHNDLRITRRTILLERLPKAFDGLSVVQISDLHFYEYTDPHYYDRVVDAIRALQPDVLIMTGDVVHYGPEYVETAGRFLARLQAKFGCFAILGNHDYQDGTHSEKIQAMLTNSGFTLLKNASHPLERGPNRLWLIGLDDLWYGIPDLQEAFKGVPTQTEATIVMAHNPLLFDPLAYSADYPVDLVLSGHTHAGHVYIPFLGPIYRKVFRMKYRYGLFKKRASVLHVTSGVGSAAFYLKKQRIGFPRFRFNTRPEIAVLELRAPQNPR
jgi:uncharacterized protein